MEYAEGGIPDKYSQTDIARVDDSTIQNDADMEDTVANVNTYSETNAEMDASSNVTPMLIDDLPLECETDKTTAVENTEQSTCDRVDRDPEKPEQSDNDFRGDIRSPSKDSEGTPMEETTDHNSVQDDEDLTKERQAKAISDDQDDNIDDIVSRGSPALDSESTQESQEPESKPEIDDITISEEPLVADNTTSSEFPDAGATINISKTEEGTNDSEDVSKSADASESDIAVTLPEDIPTQDVSRSADVPALQPTCSEPLSVFDKLFMSGSNDANTRQQPSISNTDRASISTSTSTLAAANLIDDIADITDHADHLSIGGNSDHDDRRSNADFIDTGGDQNENSLHENLDNDPIEAEQDKNKQLERNSETILPDTDSRLITTLGSKHEILKSTETERQDCVCCGRHVPPIYDCVPGTRSEKEFLCSEPCLDKLRTEISAPVREIRVRAFATQEQQQQQQQPPSVVGPMGLANTAGIGRHCANCRTAIDTVDYFVWEASEFCSQGCFLSYQTALFQNCSFCNIDIPKSYYGKYCVRFGRKINQFCNTHCLAQYKKTWTFCLFCQENMSTEEALSRRMATPDSESFQGYCSQQCKEMVCGLLSAGREAFDICSVCHKGTRIEIEFKRDGVVEKLCGNPCFVAFKFVNGLSDPEQCITCNKYFTITNTTKQLTLTYEGAEFKFCYEDCRKVFLISNRKIVMCMYCKVKKYNFDMIQHSGDAEYTVCSQNCLQLYQQCYLSKSNSPPPMNGKDLSTLLKELTQQTKMPITKLLYTKPAPPPKQRNIGTMCKPNVISKAITCRPRETTVAIQTRKSKPIIYLPIPVPIHVPIPVHMYVDPVPMPVPILITIPVPVFIPTSRKSISGIFKEIAKIKNKVPEDPLEAELLMMADIAAGVKKDESESDSDDGELPAIVKPEQIDTYQPQPQHQVVGLDGNHGFGEDVLQMALKMATDFDEPVDLEGAVSATHISAQAGGEDPSRMEMMDHKRKIIRHDHPALQASMLMGDDKPDANMCLKYTFGVNAWKQWVTTKNADLIKTVRKPKLFKTDPLQLTTDDLNFSMCLFVKEVRKPNGTEYAPDTIYYLCLGIQQYLYENGRIDNLFCDVFYDNFTNSLNEVCVKFASLYNESQYIVTRVEEEHLWESKQLGAHSPLVLLNTLMFFNTKHFALTTVEEHLQLSFSHIMKHWKRNPNLPGARHVLLRFYPPQTGDGRKKRVYEQQENDVNPLRCPVKLYEFYLSKCPESVKTRNDVFYLQPERSCVPDSPVWYSTMALTKEPLEKMLNRVKMVKEINIALLST